MNNATVFDRLDEAITVLIADPDSTVSDVGREIRELVEVAAELRSLPSPEFKMRLRIDLMRQAADNSRVLEKVRSQEGSEQVLPTLFGVGYGSYPMRRASLAASFAVHAVAITLVVASGFWVVQHGSEVKNRVISEVIELSPYALPASTRKAGGGGGGGDRDKMEASKGNLPRASDRQIVPPSIVVQNSDPKLSAEATVVAPPNLSPNQSVQVGDPLSAVLMPSNGTGSGSGIGTGEGGGIGSGIGPGVGPGYGGGAGGGIYRVGGGVSAPRAIYAPDPEYSDEARKAKYQGTVVLWAVIGADGRPKEIRVQRALGMGLDQKAIEALRGWRFDPARKDGRPVAVQVNIEVNFRLY